ncbi:MAG: hypothetical protein AB7O96_05295 [Pseudobdellovibrionaceae bacterium]
MNFSLSTVLLLFPLFSFACPDFSGSYKDPGNFLYEIQQPNCESLKWRTHENGSVTEDIWQTTCKQYSHNLAKEKSCWKDWGLETVIYVISGGQWTPFMIRRLEFKTDSQELVDAQFLTDSTGEEKPFMTVRYKKQN